ncbi:MAG TPA: DUF6259 domain-containing protein [Acidobacteriaceae bacterium]|nr:DUF6259 domain-containing protein [Acidobacteriaceae bacterium]
MKQSVKPDLRLTVVVLAFGVMGASAGAQVRTVETPAVTIRLDERTCDVVGLQFKSPELDVIGEPRLGENFRILVPQEHYQGNYFYSREQQVSHIVTANDGAVCTYDELKNSRETLPIGVTYRIQVVGEQVQFSIAVRNSTDRKLAEVMYGIVGGQKGIGNRLDTESLAPGSIANAAPRLFTRFGGGGYGGGNLGIRYDATALTYPGNMAMGWMDVWNQKLGVGYYYADQDPDTRLSLMEMELRPFSKSASVEDVWPTEEEAQGEPVGVTIGWVDMPYAGKGTFKAGPVALEAHTGDWHTASGLYRAWFDQHFTVKRANRNPDWLRKENAWQSMILSNSEDVVVHRFDELPKMAADAKKYGITTFEILGWDIGGIDRGYPQYVPDPRMGTPEEFYKALGEMRAMGVHPLIFSNIQWADTATQVFKDKLEPFVVEGEWAPDWHLSGWGEGTISARNGQTRSNMTLVSPAFPAYREYLMRQYLDLVRHGAEGFQFDKAISMAALDFNKNVPVSPDKSLTEGVEETYRELIEKARAIDPEFSLASENWYDRDLPYIDVSYLRMGQIDMPSTALRYTFPEWTATIFGESPGDFGPMNNGMRYGMVWDLAPRHYNDSVDEKLTRPLAKYVSELIDIRKRYEGLLFFGRFDDTLGATVTGGPWIRYSTFTTFTPNDGKRACVVVNFGDAPEQAEVKLDGVTGEVTIARPGLAEEKAELPVKVEIPPHRLVVVVKPE